MARTAKSGSSNEADRIMNPGPGAVIAVPAGETVEVVFDFENSAPFVAGFSLSVEGLPDAGWAEGVGDAAQVMAAAYGGGSLTMTLKPPPGASLGDVDLTASIVSDGTVQGDGPIPLVLRVEQGVSLPSTASLGAAKPTEASAVVRQPAPDPPTPPVDVPVATALPELPTVRPPRSQKPARQAMTEDPPPASVREPASMPAAEQVMERPTAPPIPAPPAVPTPVPSAPTPPSAASSASTEAPRETAKPVVISAAAARKAQEQQAPPGPPARPDKVEHHLPLSDLPEKEDEDESEVHAIVERTVLDPTDGTSFALQPAETVLLRFTLTNEARREQTYVLEEDRALPLEWINLVQDQVNLTHNGRGEVSARLMPPRNAEPGSYPFTVRVGPLGGILTPLNLVLQVLPTPAVRLTTKTAAVTSGPFGRAVDFQLAVESAGNADTAYRIAVKEPLPVDADGGTRVPADLYETSQWRYLFDREVDNLVSAMDRAPAPRPVRLRVLRKGIWWFGFRESHRMRVAAVPVTDSGNAGKRGNLVDLTAVRWRLLPMPLFLSVPLVLFMLILISSGAKDPQVTNGLRSDAIWYVFQPKQEAPQEGAEAGQLTANVGWTAPWYALLRLETAEVGKPAEPRGFVRRSYSQPVKVAPYGNDQTYTIRPFLMGSPQQLAVRFVPVRTVNRVQLSRGRLGSDAPLPSSALDETIGQDKTPIRASTVTLPVQTGWTTLNITNTTTRSGSNALSIVIHVVKRPDVGQFEIQNLKESYNLDPGQTSGAIKIRAIGDGSQGAAGEQELLLATTDAQNQLLRVKLEPRP